MIKTVAVELRYCFAETLTRGPSRMSHACSERYEMNAINLWRIRVVSLHVVLKRCRMRANSSLRRAKKN